MKKNIVLSLAVIVGVLGVTANLRLRFERNFNRWCWKNGTQIFIRKINENQSALWYDTTTCWKSGKFTVEARPADSTRIYLCFYLIKIQGYTPVVAEKRWNVNVRTKRRVLNFATRWREPFRTTSFLNTLMNPRTLCRIKPCLFKDMPKCQMGAMKHSKLP